MLQGQGPIPDQKSNPISGTPRGVQEFNKPSKGNEETYSTAATTDIYTSDYTRSVPGPKTAMHARDLILLIYCLPYNEPYLRSLQRLRPPPGKMPLPEQPFRSRGVALQPLSRSGPPFWGQYPASAQLPPSHQTALLLPPVIQGDGCSAWIQCQGFEQEVLDMKLDLRDMRAVRLG